MSVSTPRSGALDAFRPGGMLGGPWGFRSFTSGSTKGGGVPLGRGAFPRAEAGLTALMLQEYRMFFTTERGLDLFDYSWAGKA